MDPRSATEKSATSGELIATSLLEERSDLCQRTCPEA